LLVIIEKMRLSNINMDNAQSIYRMSIVQEAKGAITKYDLEKMHISYENARSDYAKSWNSYQLALNDLAYRIGVDTDASYLPSDSLAGLYPNASEEFNSAENPGERLEIKQQRLLVQMSEANIRKERSSYFPVISAYGNLTAQNLNNSYKPFDGSSWYSYNYLGIKASIPIFDGFSKQRAIRGYELQKQSAQLMADKLERDYKQEIQSTKTAVLNDRNELNNQRGNMDNAMSLYLIDNDRLVHGAIKPTDQATTYYLLLQAQNNYLNAVYTYLVDMIQYKKAMGVL